MNENQLLAIPRGMIGHLDRFFLGQDRTKQNISVAVSSRLLFQVDLDRKGTDSRRHNILMIEPAGAVKTYLPIGLVGSADEKEPAK